MKKVFRDWKVVFKDWQKSGLTEAQYCDQKKINLGLFKRHLKLREKTKTQTPAHPPSKPMFVELGVKTEASPGNKPQYLRLTTPSGCILEVPL